MLSLQFKLNNESITQQAVEKIINQSKIMNFTAKIKQLHSHHSRSARYKPNYILNVNIDIPLRPDQIMSDRPVSGQFTFSPSQLKKKLKLEVPNASMKTSRQGQSRKISSSYLGDTLNTIPISSHVNHSHKRKGTKSIYANQSSFAQTPVPYANICRKSQKNKSQMVSPRKKMSGSLRQATKQGNMNRDQNTNKKIKGVISNKIIKHGNQTKNEKFVQEFTNLNISESEDNLIKYTNNSSQLNKQENQIVITQTYSIYKDDSEEKTKKGRQLKILKQNHVKNKSLKTDQVLESDQFNIITEMREYQKKSQQKKQHLHFQYLKQKVLILASVKKIQRAWRNYKTKQLLRSYSNDISIRFTNKMKDSANNLTLSKQNILTVRSLEGPNFKKKNKFDINTYLGDNLDQKAQKIQRQDPKSNEIVSARNKFEMEELRRWQELIKNIRQGKQVQQVLQQSFRRKQQLQKDIKQSENNQYKKKAIPLKNQHQKNIQNKVFSFFDDKASKNAIKKLQEKSFHKKSRSYGFGSETSDQPVFIEYDGYDSSSQSKSSSNQYKLTSIAQKQLQQTPHRSNPDSQFSQQVGNTTLKRRHKLQEFENQIRKIDNQDSSITDSNGQNPIICEYNVNDIDDDSENYSKLSASERQKLQNLKLRKKLQLFNKLNFNELQQKSNSSSSRMKKNQKHVIEHQDIEDEDDENRTRKRSKTICMQQLNLEQQLKNRQRMVTPQEDIDKLQTYRQKALKQQNTQQPIQISSYIKQEIVECEDTEQIKINRVQRNKIYEQVQNQMIYEALLQFSESEHIVLKFKEIYETAKQTKQKENEKPEGICTNLQSIKDYLQNLVAFIFEQHPDVFAQGLSRKYFKIPSSTSLFGAYRQNTHNSLFQYKINYKSINQINNYDKTLNQNLFNDHWSYASQQIYFDPKYQDQAQQKQRVNYLKTITNIYFHGIFTAFNQCLNQYRPLYPSNLTSHKIQAADLSKLIDLLDANLENKKQYATNEQKFIVRSAYKKLSTYAVVYCGLHLEDKQHSLSANMMKQIQEERMGTLLEVEIAEQEQLIWGSLQKRINFYKVIWDICEEYLQQSILMEASVQIFNILHKNTVSNP